MAGSTSEAEAGAFVHWLQGVRAIDLLDKEVHSIEDICDGTVLFDALNHVDGEHFRNPHEDELKDNVVLRIGTLKRLYKLMIQYMAENLQFSTAKLEEPDFDALARINAPSEACKLCRLALIIAVQSDNKMSYVEVIQGLDQGDQQQLMQSIEITRKSLEPVSADEDGDEFLDIRARQPSEELSDVAKSPSKERNNLSLEYRNLVAEHEARGNTIEELEGELAKLQSKMGEITEQLEAEKRKSLHQDQRTEVTRLTEELRKCEDALASAEGEIDRLQVGLRERTRALEEAGQKAKEFDRVKDQLDEFKHTVDKLQKAESVIEKYKKKLEESADLRRKLKDIEEQNSELIDRNTLLQDEQTKMNNFKPLMDSYKKQVMELEGKASSLQKAVDTARFEKDQLTERLKNSESARASEKEELELYQERVKELELGISKASDSGATASTTAITNGDSSGGGIDLPVPVLDTELEDALTGSSMSDLKIQLRRLKRERDAAVANKADVSRIIVLENLLEDAQRMKDHYEADYLKEHQAKLVLSRELEEFRNGHSASGDGAEANIALRSRLTQLVEELDSTKKSMVELRVQHDAQSKALIIAKSDLSLVNQDQVDILRQLRASVEVEKQGLDDDNSRVRAELKEAQDRCNMLTQQVNGLLMDKIDLQTQGIGHRDEALRRERNLGELRASLAGKSLPKEAEELISALQTSHANSEAHAKALQDKLTKARAFIRQQDQLLKERPRAEEAAQESALEQELRLMASAFQDVSLRLAQELHSVSRGRRTTPYRTSFAWLGQQRRAAAAKLIDR